MKSKFILRAISVKGRRVVDSKLTKESDFRSALLNAMWDTILEVK